MWSDESIKEFWEHSESRFAGDKTAPTIVQLSRKHIRGRVLDVGSGSGALLKLLPKDSVGLDIVPRSPGVIKGSIDHMPFLNNTFNTVFCTDVLEHLTAGTLAKGVQEIHRVLSAGGKLIAVVPYEENLLDNIVYCPECHRVFHRWGHLTRFDVQSVLSLLQEFSCVDITIMPLRLMAESKIVSKFWWMLLLTKTIPPSDLFIVATR